MKHVLRAEFARSGLGQREFARVWGIALKTLSDWPKRRDAGGPKALGWTRRIFLVDVRASRGRPSLTSVPTHFPAQDSHNSLLHSLGGVVFRARTRGPCFSTT